MIISASYRTDIPAFYGDWLMNRLRAGFCRVQNPYGGQISRVGLGPGDIDGLVLWTKNIGPFLRHLPALAARGLPFVVQHSITGSPRELERATPPIDRVLDSAAHLVNAHGPRALVWRYDPILLSSLTPASFHLDNFGRLCESLRGLCDEVTVSFLQVYAKSRRHLDEAAARHGFDWRDPPLNDKRALLSSLAPIAQANGMKLSVCAQSELLVPGAIAARCVDARRLSDIAGHPLRAKARGNRAGCGCAESRDIGAYDTCPHGCAYCYAVQNPDTARRRFQSHNPESEFLFTPKTILRFNK